MTSDRIFLIVFFAIYFVMVIHLAFLTNAILRKWYVEKRGKYGVASRMSMSAAGLIGALLFIPAIYFTYLVLKFFGK